MDSDFELVMAYHCAMYKFLLYKPTHYWQCNTRNSQPIKLAQHVQNTVPPCLPNIRIPIANKHSTLLATYSTDIWIAERPSFDFSKLAEPCFLVLNLYIQSAGIYINTIKTFCKPARGTRKRWHRASIGQPIEPNIIYIVHLQKTWRTTADIVQYFICSKTQTH